MANQAIAYRRLINQGIARPNFDKPSEVVQWLGAVQAQDYGAAKWAVGLRMAGDATDATVEQAIAEGSILRTHVLRPTWHYVTPADIRGLLTLTGPRVDAACATYYRKLELDDATFKKSNTLIEKALQGGKQLTRAELGTVLQQGGVESQDLLRLTYLVMKAELVGLICSGANQGKQITYALLEERVPPSKPFNRDEALTDLVRRYFTSHGPATIADFVWWSGLTAADTRIGLDIVGGELAKEEIEGQTYWFSASESSKLDLSGSLYLLPNYDEYTVSYKDRGALVDEALTPILDGRGNILFNHVIVSDGLVVGTWKRTISKSKIVATVEPSRPLDPAETEALTAAATNFGRFMGLPVTLEINE